MVSLRLSKVFKVIPTPAGGSMLLQKYPIACSISPALQPAQNPKRYSKLPATLLSARRQPESKHAGVLLRTFAPPRLRDEQSQTREHHEVGLGFRYRRQQQRTAVVCSVATGGSDLA